MSSKPLPASARPDPDLYRISNVDAVRIGLRCISYGSRVQDKLSVAARLGLYTLFPLGTLARRLGHPLPDPARWLGGYRLRCPEGVFECPPGPAPFFMGADRSYEPRLVALLTQLRGGTFLDIGANVGFITVRAARRLGARGRVIAFEPHPVRFDYLQRNVKLNDLSNVRCIDCALGAEEGVAKLYDVNPTLGPRPLDVTLTSPSGGRNFQVRVRTADAVLAELGEPSDISLVKIDVEGFESEVLKGMSRTLVHRPPIVFEALNTVSLAETSDCLPEGYAVQSLDGRGNYLAVPAP